MDVGVVNTIQHCHIVQHMCEYVCVEFGNFTISNSIALSTFTIIFIDLLYKIW